MSVYRTTIKRPLDFVLSLGGLIVGAPFWVLISALISAESRGGVFYTQDRVGKNGRTFQIYKFRSMLRPEDSYDRDGAQLSNYQRVTKVGNWLRRSSLDEIPQLINVLKGDMSLIGPRPTLQYQVDRYTSDQLKRLDVRPGLTGLAQVSGRNALTWEQKIQKDLEYVRDLSARLDLRILVKTVDVVMRSDSTDFVSHDPISRHKDGDSRSVWDKRDGK